MTPAEALAERLRTIPMCLGSGLYTHSWSDAETLAREALAWMQEQLPSREDIANTASAVPWMPTGPYTDQPHWYAIADALLALLREKVGITKGETT